MLALRHPNVMRALHVEMQALETRVLMPLAHTNLYAYSRRVPSGARDTHRILEQILAGLAHCHEHGVIHRDLKPDNILMTVDNHVWVSDFGLARQEMLGVGGTSAPTSRPMSPEVYVLSYRAPEVLLADPRYSVAADMWAVGCIYAELMTGEVLFPGDVDNVLDQLYRIFRVVGTPTPNTWRGLETLPGYRATFPCFPRGELDAALPKEDVALDGVSRDDALAFLATFLVCDPSRRVTATRALSWDGFLVAPHD